MTYCIKHEGTCRKTHTNTSFSLTPRVASVTRACGCSAPVLIGGLTSAMVSYFHPPQILKEPDEKRARDKRSEKEHQVVHFFPEDL